MMKPVYINSVYAVLPSRGLEPDYKDEIKDANLRRRMSRAVKMGVAGALKCLEYPFPNGLPCNVMGPGCPDMFAGGYIRPDAIITATALGCLTDSEKFMSDILVRQEDMLNPTAFIQSVFNTVGAQTALIDGIKSYNMTYVHRGGSFSSALLDGVLCLSEGCQNVLVEAFDEIIPVSEDILRRLGRWREGMEGAVAFLLSDAPADSCRTVCADIRLKRGCGASHVYESMDSAVALYDAVCRIAGGVEEYAEVSLPMVEISLSLSLSENLADR